MRRKLDMAWPRSAVVGLTMLGLTLAAAGCGETPVEPAPGSYRGSGDGGFTIEFVVTEDLTVPAAAYTYTVSAACSDTIVSGEVTSQQDIRFEPALTIDGSAFDIPSARGGNLAEVRFTGDGTSVTGTWTAGGCSGSWRGTRTGEVPDSFAQTAADDAAAGPGCDGTTDDSPSDPAVQTAPIRIESSPLPQWIDGDGASDPAVGLPMPQLTGVDFAGEPVAIAADGRAKVVLAVAHWDPFSQALLPRLDTSELDADRLGADLYVLSTAVSEGRANYPPSAWWRQFCLDLPVLVDDEGSAGAASLAVFAFPSWLVIDADGEVAGRVTGDLTTQQLTALVDELLGPA